MTMRIHLIRNATLVVHTDTQHILVDPMLGPEGSLPPFALFRHAPRRNPITPLPANADAALQHLTAGLVTHCRRWHLDHLDRAGARLLTRRRLPTYCHHLDSTYLEQRGIVTHPLRPNEWQAFLDGRIMPVETQHGYGVIGKLMGPGLGYYVELPQEPTLYISGDTVLTPIVRHVLTELRPDVSVLHAGVASLDVGKPILMSLPEMLDFIRMAPGQVIATHMEALNHCSLTRARFWETVTQAGLAHKTQLPADGVMLEL
jgi:L-ascorbate metabolism protein UlaG (beta-lactamase superfamily)